MPGYYQGVESGNQARGTGERDADLNRRREKWPDVTQTDTRHSPLRDSGGLTVATLVTGIDAAALSGVQCHEREEGSQTRF